jgi:hypothetical protein
MNEEDFGDIEFIKNRRKVKHLNYNMNTPSSIVECFEKQILMNFNRIGTRDLIEMQKYLAPI